MPVPTPVAATTNAATAPPATVSLAIEDIPFVNCARNHLRYTCTSLMRSAGAEVKTIQQQSGNRNATVTLNTYTHNFERDLDGEMDRLEEYVATGSRPECVLGEVADLPNTAKTPSDREFCRLRGWDSNPRQTD